VLVPAAAAATPYFTSSAQVAAASKNDRPIVAIVGAGVPTEWNNAFRKGRSQGRGSFIGHEAARFGDMVACCDVDRSHAEQFASHYDGKCQIYGDYRKVLERSDVEAVLIATPDHWHTAIAIAAMRAGKDVYCEKPMTLTIDEGKQICRVVRHTGRVFQVGTQRRTEFKGLFLKFVALVRGGRLGKNVAMTVTTNPAERGGPFENQAPPPHLDWDFWLGQAPQVPYNVHRCHLNFRWWLEYAGGEVTDWGAHFIDIAQWALGFENTGPVEIEGTGDFPQTPNGYNAAVTFDCTLSFAGGSKIVFRTVPDGQPKGVLAEGDQGRVFVNQGRITGKPIEDLTAHELEQLDEAAAKLCKGKTPGNHMQNFFECIKDRGETISDPFTHHRTISSCHLCNIAMRLKRKLRWDPDREAFIGDEEAGRMLSRTQRKPYTIDQGES
jgi:predicted dehydrogenase